MSLPPSQSRDGTCEFRACLAPYIVFLMIFAIPMILLGVVGVAKEESSVWLPVGALAFAMAFVFLWLSRFRLIFATETVTYTSLFTGTRTIRRSEIVAADFANRTGPLESLYTFVLLTKSGEELRINPMVFSYAAVGRLINVLNEPP